MTPIDDRQADDRAHEPAAARARRGGRAAAFGRPRFSGVSSPLAARAGEAASRPPSRAAAQA